MFIEERLLDLIDYGSTFTNRFNTRVVPLRSGFKRKNANWSAPLGKFTARYEKIKDEDYVVVYHAHMACMGSLIGFRFKNWVDYKAENELIGVGTGSSQILQLTKTYSFGPINLVKNIVKPIASTVVIAVGGVPTAFILDDTTGLVTITATSGQNITWTGEFDTPVCFVSDELPIDIQATTEQGMLILNSDVDLEEIRL